MIARLSGIRLACTLFRLLWWPLAALMVTTRSQFPSNNVGTPKPIPIPSPISLSNVRPSLLEVDVDAEGVVARREDG